MSSYHMEGTWRGDCVVHKISNDQTAILRGDMNKEVSTTELSDQISIYFWSFICLSFSAVDNRTGGGLRSDCSGIWLQSDEWSSAFSSFETELFCTIGPCWSCIIAFWDNGNGDGIPGRFADNIRLSRLLSEKNCQLIHFEIVCMRFVPNKLPILPSKLVRQYHCTPSAISLTHSNWHVPL